VFDEVLADGFPLIDFPVSALSAFGDI
jgi:hypothetical protein